MGVTVPTGFHEFCQAVSDQVQAALVALDFPYDSMTFRVPIQPTYYEFIRSKAEDEGRIATAEEILRDVKFISSDFSEELMRALREHIQTLPEKSQRLFHFLELHSMKYPNHSRYRMIVDSELATHVDDIVMQSEIFHRHWPTREQLLEQSKKVIAATGMLMGAVGCGIPDVISDALTLSDRERELCEKMKSDEHAVSLKEWTIAEGNRLVREFTHIKQHFVHALNEALVRAPIDEQDHIRDRYIAAGKRLRAYYQNKINEVKFSTREQAGFLQHKSALREIERTMEVINTGFEISSHFFSPSQLGKLATGVIQPTVIHDGHTYRNDDMLLLSSRSSVARAVSKAEKVEYPTVVLLPIVLDPHGSIKQLSVAEENWMRELEGKTEFVMRLPFHIQTLGPKATFRDLQREFEHVEANIKWVNDICKKIEARYPGGYKPEMLNFTSIKNEITSQLRDLHKRTLNMKVLYSDEPVLIQKYKELVAIDKKILEFLESPKSIVNCEHTRKPMVEWGNSCLHRFLQDIESQWLTEFERVEGLLDGLKNKPVSNEMGLMRDFKEKFHKMNECLNLANLQEEHREKLKSIIDTAAKQLDALEALIKKTHQASTNIRKSKTIELDVQWFVHEMDVDFAPGLNRELKPTEIALMAHRYKIERETHHDVKKDLQRIAALRKKRAELGIEVEKLYVIPHAKFDNEDAKETHNSSRLVDCAKRLHTEVDWVSSLSNALTRRGLKVENFDKLRHYYQKQLEPLERRLKELKYKTDYQDNSSNFFLRILHQMKNAAINLFNLHEAKDAIEELKQKLSEI